jgi:hypothetical protein
MTKAAMKVAAFVFVTYYRVAYLNPVSFFGYRPSNLIERWLRRTLVLSVIYSSD